MVTEHLDPALHVLCDCLCYTVTRTTTSDNSRGKEEELLPLTLGIQSREMGTENSLSC